MKGKMNKFCLIGTIFICVMALISCGNHESASANDTWFRLQGIWERSGYGDVYVIGKKRAILYQYTRATCLQADKLDRREFTERLTDFVVQDDGTAFTAIDPDEPAFKRHYTRLETLPESCDGNSGIKGFVPTQLFEHVWHTFNDYYAFFKERGVDWPAQYVKLKDQVNDRMGKPAFFGLLRQLLSPIDDGHVYLESRTDDFRPAKPHGTEVIFRDGFPLQSEFDEYREYVSGQMTSYYDILWSYVDKGSRQQAGGKHSNLLQWGTINRRLGYLLVNSMTSISTNRNATSLDDVGAIKGILDRVMRDLRDTAAMIIDVRFNGGGDDAVGLAIVNRFTDKRRLAVAKTARSYRGETPRREAYLTPEGDKPYLKPVVVIAGPDSASATEIFIMGMRALPQVIQLGEPTNGILSDELYKTLPKGWKFTLSNEVYYDYKGVNHEVSGTVPQIQTPVFSLKDLETGHNSALETALKVLTHQEPTALGINEGTL